MNRLSQCLILSLLGLHCLVLSGCSFPPRIYRIDIQQGNHVTPEMVAKLRKGMSKMEVQEVMGTPALTHALNNDRWEYYYSHKPGMAPHKKVEKHFSVIFSNGRLQSWGQHH